MQILYDHQTFSQQEYGGISRYFSELIKGVNQSGNEAYLSVLFSNNVHLREAGLKAFPFFPTLNFPKKAELLYRANGLYSLVELRRRPYTVFHTTNYDPYFISHLKGKPFVVTFYDLIHERFGGQFKELGDVTQTVSYKKMLAERATRVIAISESTKRDLVELHQIDPDKIYVVHLGSSFAKPPGNRIADKPNPYLLYVGKRDAYKNFPCFLRAVSPLLKRHKLTLVCAGGGSFTPEEQSLIQSLGLEPLVMNQRVDDKTLPGLYASARAFVFPSLYEGFGIPVLEAFACGCPCVLSNTSSLPEVAADAALYFDPTSEESIALAVERVISDDALRDSLITKGQQRLSLFSWDRTVAQTLEVYKTCL